MKPFMLLLAALCLFSCASKDKERSVDKKTVGLLPTEAEPVLVPIAEFKGAQVTGVTMSKDGRLFANFPRWRDEVPFSVVEILPDGTHRPYPDQSWNDWKGRPEENKFTCVQSVFAHENSLYVLDPSAPEMKKVIGQAKLYEFDLATNRLKRKWVFDESVAPEKSYLNDLRIDDEQKKIFITDSGLGGIVVLDLKTGNARRLLDKHPSTKAEDVTLTVEKKEFKRKIHSDGIALSPVDGKLYYHALTGYHLYRVPADALGRTTRDETQLVKKVENLGVTPAPDGMIFDEKGNLYMADLERNAVSYRTPSGEMKILIQDERIKWPDTFTLDTSGNLIFTDSLLQEAQAGKPVDDLTFRIYKVALPQSTSRTR
jgi:sugar lactone lactonase YvrE